MANTNRQAHMKATILTTTKLNDLLREDVPITFVESNQFGGHVVSGEIAFGNEKVTITLTRELMIEIALHLIGHECEF